MNTQRAQILIVDDDREIRNILSEFLMASYDCITVDAADKALALLSTKEFDLILSDISMASMSGLEMLPHVAALSPDSVVVMVSGQRTIDFAIDSMRAGAFDYIMKPFDLREVGEVVGRALACAERKKETTRVEHRRSESAKAFRHALTNDEFIVHFQQQVDIQTGAIVGAEALLRWQHPQLGFLLPADFISLAEATGMIVPLGESVLRVACAQASEWHRRGAADLRIAVNVSPQQLRDPNFPQIVAATLRQTQLSAACLEIEVTETSLMKNAEGGIQTLTQLREMGVRIAIDDFGTGYSSLSYLKDLPLDSVKLDASFVRNATTDPDDAALVMAIITLAHNLKLKVIAEGIEREDQLAFLRLLRCDEGQGYFFGKPSPPDKLALPFIYLVSSI